MRTTGRGPGLERRPRRPRPPFIHTMRRHERTDGGSHGESAGAILAAFLANMAIAVTKFIGFVITGSSSLLAEAIHSVADSSNQGLLVLGGKRAAEAGDRAPSVRLRPQPLLLVVRRRDRPVQRRRPLRPLRGLAQDQPPGGDQLTRRGHRDPRPRDGLRGLRAPHRAQARETGAGKADGAAVRPPLAQPGASGAARGGQRRVGGSHLRSSGSRPRDGHRGADLRRPRHDR